MQVFPAPNLKAGTTEREPANQRSARTEADAFAESMEQLHSFCITQMRYAQQRYEDVKRGRAPAQTYKTGDKVWLDTRNIATRRPSKKLDYKNCGPFEVKRVVAPDVYKLTLPTSMRIHDTFHTNLLRPSATAPFPGQNDVEPQPTIAEHEGEDQEHWEVCAIEASRWTGKKKSGVKYTVRWVGGAVTEERHGNLVGSADEVMADFHHKNPSADGPPPGWKKPVDWQCQCCRLADQQV